MSLERNDLLHGYASDKEPAINGDVTRHTKESEHTRVNSANAIPEFVEDGMVLPEVHGEARDQTIITERNERAQKVQESLEMNIDAFVKGLEQSETPQNAANRAAFTPFSLLG